MQVYPLVVFRRVIIASEKLDLGQVCREVLLIAGEDRIYEHLLGKVDDKIWTNFAITLSQNCVIVRTFAENVFRILNMLRSNNSGTTILTRKILPLFKLTYLFVPILGRVIVNIVVLGLLRPHGFDQIEKTAAR